MNDSAIWRKLKQVFHTNESGSAGSASLPAHALPCIKTGYLSLEDSSRRQWNKFKVVLAGTSLMDVAIYFFETSEKRKPETKIQLVNAQVDVMQEIIMIITDQETAFLCSETEREAEDWADKICDTLELFAFRTRKSTIPSAEIPSAQIPTRHRRSTATLPLTVQEIQSRDVSTRIYEFQEMFIDSSNDEGIRNQAARGYLAHSCLRSVCWKFWIGYLCGSSSPVEWITSSKRQRKRYDDLRLKFPLPGGIGFNLNEGELSETCSNTMNDSLDGADTNITDEDKALFHDIYKDVHRTRSSMEFFRQDQNQYILVGVLYTWAKVYRDISYKQGMSELAAVIFYLLRAEQFPEEPTAAYDANIVDGIGSSEESDFDDSSYVHVHGSKNINCARKSQWHLKQQNHSAESEDSKLHEEALRCLTDGNFVEHDTFLLFEIIMNRFNGMFSPFGEQNSGAETPESEHGTTLHKKLHRIHHEIVHQCAPALHAHMESIGLQPEMYLLRWIRVLFSREFEIYHVWQVWDLIFSMSAVDLQMVDYVCASIVHVLQDQILGQEDVPGVLIALRDLTNSIDIDRLLRDARDLHESMMVAEYTEISADFFEY